jgi:hypothetical protein
LSVGRGGRVPHQLTSSGDTGSSRPSRTHCRSQRRLTAMASVSAPCRCSASKTGLAVDWQMQCVALRKSSSCWHSAPCLRPADGDHRGMHACMPSAGIGDTAAGAGKTCRICAPRQYVTRRAQLSSRDRLLAQERRHASQHPLGTLGTGCRRAFAPAAAIPAAAAVSSVSEYSSVELAPDVAARQAAVTAWLSCFSSGSSSVSESEHPAPRSWQAVFIYFLCFAAGTRAT